MEFLAQTGGEAYNWVREGGALAVVLMVVWFLITGKIHTHGEFKEMREDRNLWRDIALRGASAAERATDLAQTMATKRHEGGGPE